MVGYLYFFCFHLCYTKKKTCFGVTFRIIAHFSSNFLCLKIAAPFIILHPLTLINFHDKITKFTGHLKILCIKTKMYINYISSVTRAPLHISAPALQS